MVKFLELWAIDDNGIPLFYHRPSKIDNSKKYNKSPSDIEPQLISGFFSAVQTMVEVSLSDSVVVIELQTSKLIFSKIGRITFVGRILINQGINSAKYTLKNITQNFIRQFDEVLNDWQGNTKAFDPFGKKIEQYF